MFDFQACRVRNAHGTYLGVDSTATAKGNDIPRQPSAGSSQVYPREAQERRRGHCLTGSQTTMRMRTLVTCVGLPMTTPPVRCASWIQVVEWAHRSGW